MAGQKAYYATIKDVAKLAGTSTATVSYVLNGSTDRVMSPQLRQRVLDAARELHYTKSAVASSLRAKQRGLVSILIPQFSNIYFTRVCESVEDVVFANDFMPMICDTREDPERERRLLENAIAQRVDGVILGPTNAGWENTALLRKMNIPYVVIGREIAPRRDGERNDSYFAGDDSYQAGFLAGQCLAQNGHRRIGVVEWNGRVSSAVERDLGFYDAVREQVKLGGGMEEVVVGVVGVLQLEVLEYRLNTEYNVEIRMQQLPFEQLRWVQNDPDTYNLRDLDLTSDTKAVEDMKGNRLLLFTSDWAVRWAETHNESLQLSEFGNI